MGYIIIYTRHWGLGLGVHRCSAKDGFSASAAEIHLPLFGACGQRPAQVHAAGNQADQLMRKAHFEPEALKPQYN